MTAKLCLCLAVALPLLFVFVCGDMLVGGWKDADPNSPEVQKAASFAVKKYNQMSNDVHVFVSKSIVSAQTQVVAGIKFRLNMEIGRTQCRKNGGDNMENCDLIEDSNQAQTLRCTFEVVERAWENVTTLVKNSCETE
ncbi:cystatin-like isoform 1-T2 [Rhinophrynus dorsalis]